MTDEQEKQEAGSNGQSAAGKKYLVIGLLAGLIFGGGGVAGFYLMQSGADSNVEPEAEVVEEKAPELPDYQYARMDKLQLPVFYNGRILNYTVMDVSLEVIGNENKMIAVKNVLIVRDALLRYYSVNSVGRDDNPRIVDYEKLSDKIMELANAEANRDFIRRVIISESRSF